MPGLYSIATRNPGALISGLVYNSDMQAHVNGRDAQFIQSFGASQTQFDMTTDPYPGNVENLAVSLGDEIARLRFVIAGLKKPLAGGAAANWYDPMAAPGFATIGARIQRTSSVTVLNNTSTKIDFTGGTLDWNNPNTVWSGANPTRFTAPNTGLYLAFASAVWDALASGGIRNLALEVNGGSFRNLSTASLAGSSVAQHQTISLLMKLTATDYVEFIAFQSSGSTLHLVGDGAQSVVGGLVFLGSLPSSF